jgi:hypothetical protein
VSPRRKRPPLGDVLRPVLGPLEGARIPGGCESCDAYQTAEPVEAGVWLVTVHHDDWCPRLQASRSEARP